MRMHRMAAVWFLCLLAIAPFAIGQTTAPATIPSTRAATKPSAGISDGDLLSLCRQELGPQFRPADLSKYLTAHALIENYFAATGPKDRSAIVQQLSATSLDADTLGRITRIRRSWQDLPAGTYYINDSFGPFAVKYFLGIPKTYSRLAATPLVIVLPTADEFLTNPPANNLGVTAIYRNWMTDELARQKDAIVLMPLLNLDELYGPGRKGMNNVIQPMLHAGEIVNIDPQRVYLMGHAMGGHATWNLALHYPTYFSAIAPLGGAADADWQRLRLMNLRNILPVVWDDSDDQLTPVASSRAIVKAIQAMKFDVQYTETKALGHVPPSQVIDQLNDAMRARVRELYPKEVFIQSNKPEAAFNRADWVQIYQPLRAGPEQRLLITHGTGPMIVNQNTASVKATLAGNEITMTADNVLLMRFYFNASMIDFKHAVSIKINGKNRFEGFVQPSIDEMLKDQIFLGRGWRYYSAALDLDLSAPGLISTTQLSR